MFNVLHGQYDVSGFTVNIVCRLLEVAKPTDVLLTESAEVQIGNRSKKILIVKWGHRGTLRFYSVS